MDNDTKLLLIGLVIFTIVFVSSISFAFGDQVHPHKRCEIYEKMTWNEEVLQHLLQNKKHQLVVKMLIMFGNKQETNHMNK